MATLAITRDNPEALKRHLAAGLDPNALAYEGYGLGDHNTLLEMAARWDRLECFQALVHARARLTDQVVWTAMRPNAERWSVLRHALSTGLVDPFEEVGPGVRWVDEAAFAPGEASEVFARHIAERERGELGAAAPKSTRAHLGPRPKRL